MHMGLPFFRMERSTGFWLGKDTFFVLYRIGPGSILAQANALAGFLAPSFIRIRACQIY